MNRCYLALLALLTGGCARPQEKVQAPAVDVSPTVATAKMKARKIIVQREITRLVNASPDRDLARAWANKDTRFLSVNCVGTNVPGLPDNRLDALVNKHGTNPIKGTTDFIEFPEIARLNALATRYAARYNPLLLQKLDGQENTK